MHQTEARNQVSFKMQGCHFGAPANKILVQYVLSNNAGQYIQTSRPQQREKVKAL